MSTQRKQTGIVSITVTLVLMLVISMIVLGFAQVSRREQRQSLDRHLSTQAYFAAESGVNDVIDVLRNAPPGSNYEKASCNNPSENNLYRNLQYSISTSDQVSYTCVLVTTEVQFLRTTLANDGAATGLPLYPKTGTMASLRLRWTPTGASAFTVANCSGSANPTTLTANSAASWRCPFGLLRVDLVPLTPAGIRRGSTAPGDGLLGSQKALFLYPTNTAGPATYSLVTTPSGSIRRMQCTATDCTATISGLAPASNYGIRAMAVYAGGTLEITALDALNNTVLLTNAQAQIDVTGKAQDILRRLQVRVPLNANHSGANYALESGSSICKRFGSAPGLLVITGITGQDQSNPMCATTTAP